MIHIYKMGQKNIVMDIFSGAVHVVDDCVYDILDLLGADFDAKVQSCPADIIEKLSDTYTADQIKEAYEEICELVEQHLLYTNDIYKEVAKDWHKKSYIKAMCLHVCIGCISRIKNASFGYQVGC